MPALRHMKISSGTFHKKALTMYYHCREYASVRFLHVKISFFLLSFCFCCAPKSPKTVSSWLAPKLWRLRSLSVKNEQYRLWICSLLQTGFDNCLGQNKGNKELNISISCCRKGSSSRLGNKAQDICLTKNNVLTNYRCKVFTGII